jgi:ribosome-interacting GTPase 1
MRENILPYIAAVNKMDLEKSKENLNILKELMPELPLINISASENNNLDHFKRNDF